MYKVKIRLVKVKFPIKFLRELLSFVERYSDNVLIAQATIGEKGIKFTNFIFFTDKEVTESEIEKEVLNMIADFGLPANILNKVVVEKVASEE